MMAGPMPHPEYMHPHAMGAGGQYIPIPMQVLHPLYMTHLCLDSLAMPHPSTCIYWLQLAELSECVPVHTEISE